MAICARDRFVGATRRADGAILINLSSPEVGGGVPVERIALADGGWQDARSPARRPYSVVAQPWFVGALEADGVRVSEPYRFAEGRGGVTLALRHIDAGRPAQGCSRSTSFSRTCRRPRQAER